MCLRAYEVNPFCDDCFAKINNLTNNQILTDEELCDECRDLPKHYCFCCDADQKYRKKDLDIINGVCRSCRQM